MSNEISTFGHPGKSDRIWSRSKYRKYHLLSDSGYIKMTESEYPRLLTRQREWFSDPIHVNWVHYEIIYCSLSDFDFSACLKARHALPFSLLLPSLHVFSYFTSFHLQLPPLFSLSPFSRSVTPTYSTTKAIELRSNCFGVRSPLLFMHPKINATLEGNVVPHTLNWRAHCSVCETYQIRFSNKSFVLCVCVSVTKLYLY